MDFEVLEGWTKTWETCGKNFHQFWYLYSSMVPSLWPKNLIKHISDVIPKIYSNLAHPVIQQKTVNNKIQ